MPARRSLLRLLVLSAALAATVTLGVTWTPPAAAPPAAEPPATVGARTPAALPPALAPPKGQADAGEPPLLSWWQIDGESLADAGGRLRLGPPESTVGSDDGSLLASITYGGEPQMRGLLRFADTGSWTLRSQVEVHGYVAQSRLTRLDGPGLLAFAGDELVWIGSSATQSGDVNAHDFTVYRAGVASARPETVVELPVDTQPWAMALLDGDRLAVAATSWDGDGGQPGSPTVLLADLAGAEIDWTLSLDGVEDGWRHTEAGGDVLTESITPGAAWDADRERLYLAHAHDSGVTVVDLAAGTAARHDVPAETAGAPPPSSLRQRLAAWFLRPAHAKLAQGTSRTAALSPDGATLALSGVRIEPTRDPLGNVTGESMTGLGVVLVDTATMTARARFDLAVSDVTFAPDGRLLATGVADRGTVPGNAEGSGLYVLDLGTGAVLAHRYGGHIPWVRGFDTGGTRAYVYAGDRLEVLDTGTWAPLAARDDAYWGLPHLGLLAAWPEHPPGAPSSAPWPSAHSFDAPTGTVLLFDDGYDGVVAVDLDARVAARRVLDGQRAGDQPHRLVRAGDHLLVGWGSVADTAGDTVVWCEAGCDTLRVSRPGRADVTIDPPRRRQAFAARSARVSPDGHWVAAIVADAAGGDGGGSGPGARGTVVVADTAVGDVTALTAPLVPAPAFLGWSPDGAQLYFTTDSYGDAETMIGRYDPHEGEVDLAALPFGGLRSFVVLERDEAAAFLEAEPGDRQGCGPPRIQPSGRHTPCAFDY